MKAIFKATFVTDEEFRASTNKRVVVCDREYTSYTLIRTLDEHGFYTVGTCMPTRLGFPLEIVWGKTKPQRGQYNVAYDKENPHITATAWRDNGNVYMLASGQSTKPTAVQRRMRTGPESLKVPCPQIVDLYNEYMNGTDVHDQKRLQRFSIQRKVNFQLHFNFIFYVQINYRFVSRNTTSLLQWVSSTSHL